MNPHTGTEWFQNINKSFLCKKGGAILMSLFIQFFKSNIYFYFNKKFIFLFFCIEKV